MEEPVLSRAVWVGFTLIVLLLTNGYAYGLMKRDKRYAIRGERRIPERALFVSAAAFGALGGVLAMRRLHHKTRHKSFQIGFPLMLVVQTGLVLFWVGWLLIGYGYTK